MINKKEKTNKEEKNIFDYDYQFFTYAPSSEHHYL
jgi:hypothetical protein